MFEPKLTYWAEGPKVTHRGLELSKGDQRSHLETFQANLAANVILGDDNLALAACTLAAQLIAARIKAAQWRKAHGWTA